VVAIAQGKGGVGKTTTTMNLAAAIAAGAGQVLCVDLDPRYSLTRWLLPDGAAPAASLAELLRGHVDVDVAARPTTLERVSLIARYRGARVRQRQQRRGVTAAVASDPVVVAASVGGPRSAAVAAPVALGGNGTSRRARCVRSTYSRLSFLLDVVAARGEIVA